MIVHSLITFNVEKGFFSVNNLLNSKKFNIKKELFFDLWFYKKQEKEIKLKYGEEIIIFLDKSKLIKKYEKLHIGDFENWVDKSWLPSISFHSMGRNINAQDFKSGGDKEQIRLTRMSKLESFKLQEKTTDGEDIPNELALVENLSYASSINIVDALLNRETCRQFNGESIEKDDFFRIFQGVFSWINKHKSGRNIIIESSNSFFEYFVFINNINGIKKGLYKFNDSQETLSLIEDKVIIQDIIRLGIGQKAFLNVNFVFIPVLKSFEYLTLYNSEKCLRNGYIDLGALGQQVILGSECLGLSSFMTPAIKDNIGKEILGEKYDGVKNIIGYLIGVGKKLEK